MGHAVASYLPESMLIKLNPELAPLWSIDKPEGFDQAVSSGIFFHEYLHYLHNISTLSGIVVFINTIELWRMFRHTFDKGGFSVGSALMDAEWQEKLRMLSSYLIGARKKHNPDLKHIISPVDIKITSLTTEVEVANQSGELLTVLVCDAEVSDQGGNAELCVVRIGTLELLESIAWLLENRMVKAINPMAEMELPPIFPYRVVEAAARCAVPDLDDDGIIACILAALQSSDAPEALEKLFVIAAEALRCGQNPSDVIREKVKDALNQSQSKLDEAFSRLDMEFANDGIFATAVRQIVAAARRAFELRRVDPFFELQIIQDARANKGSFEHIIQRFVPCAVLQMLAGHDEDIERDVLMSFLPPANEHGQDPENGLRVLHSVFDFLGRHRNLQSFVSTRDARKVRCPFFTCCNLPLRAKDPAICRDSPWRSIDWPEWDQEKRSCWYGTAVRITRPPDGTAA